MMRKASHFGSAFALGMILSSVNGCEEQPSPPVLESVQGTITKIDLKRRMINLSFFRKDLGRNEEILARVSPQCEINQQGIISSFDRLRVGQMITGFATVEHFSDGDLYHFLKIYPSEPAASSVSTKSAVQR